MRVYRNYHEEWDELTHAVTVSMRTRGCVVKDVTGYHVVGPDAGDGVIWRPTADDLDTGWMQARDWWEVPRQIAEDILNSKEG